jgi:hypothetical protein
MSGMTPRQILAEIIQDYRYNVKMGMPVDQSLEVLKAMVVDMIEFEKEKAFDLGVESGRSGAIHDLWTESIMAGKLKQFEELMALKDKK